MRWKYAVLISSSQLTDLDEDRAVTMPREMTTSCASARRMPAAHQRQVPVQVLRAVEARGRELDALEVVGVDQLLPAHGLVRGQSSDDAAGDDHLVGGCSEVARRDLLEPLEDLIAGVLHRPA